MNNYSSYPLNRFFFLFFVLLSLLLVSCVDLSGTASAEKKERTRAALKGIKVDKKLGEVHTMRGGLGVFSKGMNQLKTAATERYHVPASSSMWYNAGDVSRSIVDYYYKNPNHRPIILIGHSLGANEQIKVARNLDKLGIPVALLVTVDAVSQTRVPGNVQHALNIYKPGFVPMFSGLKLKAVNPSSTRIDNINVNELKNIHVNHFTIDKDEKLKEIILTEVEKVLNNGTRKQA